jgi:N4-gp56 family major capsid protein
MAVTAYGDISPRTAAYAVKKMLVRALPYLVIEKFGQAYPIPNNASKFAKFRRFEALAKATTPLTEGVTPQGKTLTVTDVTAELKQYGDFVTITDVIQDTHEDPVFDEAQTVIAEQAAQTIEAVRFGILKAGTNVYYNGTPTPAAVTDVDRAMNATYGLGMLRKVTRGLKRQNARYITKITGTSPNYATASVQASFIALMHVDCEADVRAITGFINAKDYAQAPISEFEIGAVESVRFIVSTVFEPWADAGDTTNVATQISTSGVRSDVYPLIVLAQDAYGLVPLKGKDSLAPMVLNPNVPREGDPLGQRGYVGWKAMTTAVILNQLFMGTIKTCATELT